MLALKWADQTSHVRWGKCLPLRERWPKLTDILGPWSSNLEHAWRQIGLQQQNHARRLADLRIQPATLRLFFHGSWWLTICQDVGISLQGLQEVAHTETYNCLKVWSWQMRLKSFRWWLYWLLSYRAGLMSVIRFKTGTNMQHNFEQTFTCDCLLSTSAKPLCRHKAHQTLVRISAFHVLGVWRICLIWVGLYETFVDQTVPAEWLREPLRAEGVEMLGIVSITTPRSVKIARGTCNPQNCILLVVCCKFYFKCNVHCKKLILIATICVVAILSGHWWFDFCKKRLHNTIKLIHMIDMNWL